MWDNEMWRAESAGCCFCCGKWIGYSTSYSMTAIDWKQLMASITALSVVTSQGAVGDGELVSIHDVQAYQLAGCQDGWGVLGSLNWDLSRLGWLAQRPLLREAPLGPAFRRPRVGFCFRFVGAGRWNLQWGIEEKVPSLLLPFL
jgi:hypothetical protein